MAILISLIIGLLIGLVAKFLMPGRDPGGFLITSLLGIGGSVVAHFIGRAMGWYLDGEPAGFFASVIGAMILLGVYRMMRGKSA